MSDYFKQADDIQGTNRKEGYVVDSNLGIVELYSRTPGITASNASNDLSSELQEDEVRPTYLQHKEVVVKTLMLKK